MEIVSIVALTCLCFYSVFRLFREIAEHGNF